MKRAGSFPGFEYFTYAGTVFAVVLLVTYLERLQLGQYGWMFVRQMLAAAVVTAILGAAFLAAATSARARGLARAAFVRTRLVLSLEPESRQAVVTLRLWSIAQAIGRFPWFAAAVLLGAGAVVMVLDHRLFTLAIALTECAVAFALVAVPSLGARLRMFLVAAVTWSLCSGLTYTHLADWLTNFGGSEGLAVAAFVIAMALVAVAVLSRDEPRREVARWEMPVVTIVALVVFAAYALRTDHLLADWAPIHRSYFADVSQLVRDGHWVLWDVPSLYGFLSMVTLAVIPAANGWQALYELTAAFLVAEAFAVFAILRWARPGWANAAFAILFPLGTLFGAALPRYAWDGRLYPQGGLRFIWVVALLFIAFLRFVWRDRAVRVRLLRWLGHVVWIVAVLWSFESGVWATTIWMPYLVTDALTAARPVRSPLGALRAVAAACWPLPLLAAIAIGVVTAVYRHALHAGPDWRGYVEFAGLFTSGKIRSIFWVQPYGAGWVLLLVLAAAGALGLHAICRRRWDVLPLLVATWLAVWATSSYFAVEPLDFYVTLLFAVLAPAIAIVIFVSRDVLPPTETGTVTRLSLLPIAVIAVAVALGEPSRLAAAAFPFSAGWHGDVTQSMPLLPRELHDLMARDGVRSRDRVIFPEGPLWTELDQGLIMPFDRGANGKIFEYHAWLPMSPVAPRMLYNGLNVGRRRVYVERFLQREKNAGWYVTYRSPADCSKLDPGLVTTRTMRSTNFEIARCVIRRRAARR